MVITIKAPSYQELFDLTAKLQARLNVLERAQESSSDTASASTPTPAPVEQPWRDFQQETERLRNKKVVCSYCGEGHKEEVCNSTSRHPRCVNCG